MTPDTKDVIDLHRQVSIEFLKHTSGFAVRTPKGQKDPGAIQWDPKSATREKSNATLAVLERTNDNLGVHLFGTLVDVDIDSDNPLLLAALDHFLPHTSHVWGRPSRPRTHRLYELASTKNFDAGVWPFLAKIQAFPDVNMEVRGGETRSARYSLLPGSMHPSGETYEWHDLKGARSTVGHVSEEKLMQGVRFAIVAALVSKYWQEGVRNELCKAFSGFMYRASSYCEELNTDLAFGEEEAWALMEGVMEIADDDPADRAMRLRTFEQTWEKGRAGEAIVGATRIAELTGDEQIVGMLYILLANTPDLQALDKLFEQFVVIRNTINLVDLDLGSKGNYVLNKESFVFTLAGRYINSPKGRVPVSAVFLNSPRRTIVDRIAVHPAREKIFVTKAGLKAANVWTGWEIPPCEEATTPEDVAWWSDYLLRVLARGDERLAEWIEMWAADIFQNPGEKPGTALVLVGAPGAGKSFLFEKVLRPIIGSAHSVKVGSIEKLVSKFNSHMGGKLLVQGEEVMNSNRRADADALKDLITSGVRMVEMKGRDAFEMEDYARHGFTSNHTDRAVNIEAGDRRYTIAHVSDEYAFNRGLMAKKRDAFFSALHAMVEVKNPAGETVPNGEQLAKLHRHLLQVKVERKTIMSAYDTAIKRDTQQVSSRGMDAWLLAMCEWASPLSNIRENDRGENHSFIFEKGKWIGTNEWPQFMHYPKLEQSMRLYCSRDYGEAKSAQQILKYFRDKGLLNDTEDRQFRHGGEKVRVRPFPSRELMVDFLTGLGYDVITSKQEEPEVKDEKEDGPAF